MRTGTVVGIWAFLVVSAVMEVVAFYSSSGTTLYFVLGGLAFLNAIISVFTSMGLKDEPRAIKYLFLVPVIFVFVLMVALTTTFSLD